MNIYEIYPQITQNPIFCAASPETVNKYLNGDTLAVKHFDAGELVYSPENYTKSVGLILSGKAEVTSVAGRERAVLKTHREGNMFGVANLYSDEPPPSIISASERAEMLFIDGDAFCAVIENDMNAMRAYLAFLSKKIIYLNKEISTFTAPNTEKKLAFSFAKISVTACSSRIFLSLILPRYSASAEHRSTGHSIRLRQRGL